MMRFKVPHLQRSEIEASASELRRKHAAFSGGPLKPPIPIDDIVEKYLKLEFALVDLKKLLGLSDVLGATWFDEMRVSVDASLEGNEGRYSFTLAHEVGHWQLHRPLYEMEKGTVPLFRQEDLAPLPAIVCRSGARKEPAEWQADQFAGCLLMPRTAVQTTLRDLGQPSPLTIPGFNGQASGPAVHPLLQDLATSVIDQGGFTNVSKEAMRVRLVELQAVTAVGALPGIR